MSDPQAAGQVTHQHLLTPKLQPQHLRKGSDFQHWALPFLRDMWRSEKNPRLHSSDPSYLLFETVFLTSLELHQVVENRLGSTLIVIFLSPLLFLPLPGLQMLATTSGFLHGFWGFEPRSSNRTASTFPTESSPHLVLNSAMFLREVGFLRQKKANLKGEY